MASRSLCLARHREELAGGPRAPPAAIDAIIDVRSPAEYALDHIPGAINCPVLDNSERALVGTLYRRQSPEAAFDAGRRIVRSGARAIVERIAEHVDWELDLVELDANVAALVDGGYAHLAERLACRPAASVREFIADYDKVFVVENNFDGQLHKILLTEVPHDATKLISVCKCDGLPLSARFITESVMTKVS